jgi:hypothetical protein
VRERLILRLILLNLVGEGIGGELVKGIKSYFGLIFGLVTAV